jgi:D-lactate dehydrogenase (cytochrome)
MRAEHGDALDVMKRIKNVMDPKGLFNPGKLYGP